MSLQVDRDRLAAAYHTARSELLAERTSAGHWVGKLSSSPLATATAISALVLAEQSGTSCGLPVYTPGEAPSHIDDIYRGDLSELIVHSLHWLAEQQNDDGGWGDTDLNRSNIATTMLVEAAFHLTGVPAKFANLLERAEQYVESRGGIAALRRRYEGDKSLAVPILANCALADMTSWRKVPALPFELACLPRRWQKLLNLPVVSFALPALVAVGQARQHHAPPRNPLVRWIRNLAKKRSLAVLEAIQPASGGFMEATPLTSFVVMSLASMGQANHVVVRRGVEFLLSSVRTDGSWPIDTNLAVRNTSQAIAALVHKPAAGHHVEQHGEVASQPVLTSAIDWLLASQHRERNSFIGTEPGGWAWTDLSGGVPDAYDTAATLLALAAWHRSRPDYRKADLRQAALSGVRWLLDLQNTDGGWPTFCRGWGKLPFDRSSTDVTAQAMRSLRAWGDLLKLDRVGTPVARRIKQATQQAWQYLQQQQQPDGSWLPLWFGNESHQHEANLVYGTSTVLRMCYELGYGKAQVARRALNWLTDVQLASGGWGAVLSAAESDHETSASAEETAWAVAALLPFHGDSEQVASSVEQGVSWLIDTVEQDRHVEPAPLGLYFTKLWYYERLYPQIFATGTLALACHELNAKLTPLGVAP